jgi:hypothetical protein
MLGRPNVYIAVECANDDCDATIMYGLLTLDEHRGCPVVGYDTAATTSFPCPECGKTTYTGELETMTDV